MVFNLSQNELEASYGNYNQIDEDVLKKRPSETIDYQEKVNIYLQIELNSFVNLIAENINSSSINYGNKLESIEITSDKQYQSENEYIVEGNVQIKQNNMQLRADKLAYDQNKKIFTITGNIKFICNEQFLTASTVNYNLNSKEGFIKDVYGTINFDTLDLINKKNNTTYKDLNNLGDSIKDVKLNKSSSVEITDIKSPQNLKLKIKEMTKWRFQTDEIKIQDNIWSSKLLYLTNDPYNEPQLLIKNTDFKVIEKNGETFIKSRWSSMILENKVKVPLGRRNYKANQGTQIKWGIGYDEKNKDGFYITRNAETKDFGIIKDFRFKKEFYVQRALSGETKSFSKKGDSVLSTKIKQDAKISDYFGFETTFNTSFLGFNLDSEIALNSLDLEKFKKIIKSKTELSKVLYANEKEDEEKELKLSLFGTYRDKVWNGSLGEKDILTAYGLKLENIRKWENKNVKKSSRLAAGYGEYQSNRKGTKDDLISRNRFNFLWYREHIYPIWKQKNNSPINKKFIYKPDFINKGLDLLVESKVDFYRYSDENYQNLFTFKAGPKLTLGNFQKNFLDYSEFSILGKTRISQGESSFDFDQAVDNHAIEISLKQQLLGPLVLRYSSEYNLDVNSSEFHNFTNNQYELSWNRRAYKFGLFYNPDRETGGFNFEINSFNFGGNGEKFK